MPTFPTKEQHGDCYFVTVEETDQMPALLMSLVKDRLPKAYRANPIRDIQVLCPMNRGNAGTRALNEALQLALYPPTESSVLKFGTMYSVGDKVMQIENNYDRDVFNGDIGLPSALTPMTKSSQSTLMGVMWSTRMKTMTNSCFATPRPFITRKGANTQSWCFLSPCSTM